MNAVIEADPGQDARPRRPRHRKLLIVLAVLAVVLGTGAVMVHRLLSGGGKTTEVPLKEIVRRYQASTTAFAPPTSSQTTAASSQTAAASVPAAAPPPAAPAVFPAPGVYVYTTTGGDAIDIVGNTRHSYPETSTITVTASDCGVRQRWDVVAERWQEWELCLEGGAVAEVTRTNFDEFFNIAQTDTWACTGDPRPVDMTAAGTWTRTCRKGDHDDVLTGTVVGAEPMSVGGVEVQTLHVRVETDNGRADDRQTTDSWYVVGTDLLVARSATNHTTNDTAFGVVHYDEEYELLLTSLEPLS